MSLLNPSDPGLGNLLTQATPGVLTAIQVYSPPAGVETRVETVMITNDSDFSITVQIFHDDDGTTFDVTTQVFKGAIPANGSFQVDNFNIYLSNVSSNLAVQASRQPFITFSFYGREKEI